MYLYFVLDFTVYLDYQQVERVHENTYPGNLQQKILAFILPQVLVPSPIESEIGQYVESKPSPRMPAWLYFRRYINILQM